MSIGLAPSKSEVDNRFGDLARRLQQTLDQDVPTMKEFLDGQTDNQLQTLGYAPGEIAIVRSAIADLETLRLVWRGVNAQTPAKNFTTFVKQLWGVGQF